MQIKKREKEKGMATNNTLPLKRKSSVEVKLVDIKNEEEFEKTQLKPGNYPQSKKAEYKNGQISSTNENYEELFQVKKKRTNQPKDLLLYPAQGVEWTYENGLRKVIPYDFCYKAFAKGRWIGRSILDVFVTEFRDQSAFYYVSN